MVILLAFNEEEKWSVENLIKFTQIKEEVLQQVQIFVLQIYGALSRDVDPVWSYADPDPPNLVYADPDPGQKITNANFSRSQKYSRNLFFQLGTISIVKI